MAQEDPLSKGVDFIKAQHAVFQRNAWIARWAGWICGWGSASLAIFAGVAGNLIEHEATAHIWAGLLGGILAAVNQTIRFESWADAYYKGHLILETALGDHELGSITAAELSAAWHQAEANLPGNAPKVAAPGK